MRYNIVFYMIRSIEGNGYIFPSEIEQNNINLELSASAIWTIPCANLNRLTLPPKITFKAVENKTPIDLLMHKVNENGNVYFVDTQYGKFYFRIKNIHKYHNQYIGSFLPFKIKLAMVEPMNIMQMEEVCKKYKFFFVGETTKQHMFL